MLGDNQSSISDSGSSDSCSSRSNNSSNKICPTSIHFATHRMTQIGVIRSNFLMKLEATTSNDGIGCRSPLQQHPGNSSPPTYSSHGARTVREFEEQMSNLRKENFNLKLRLYFIEESIPSYHSRQQHQQQHQNQNQQNHQQSPESGSSGDGCGHENIMKQLIDTKVEREVLRKELQEKQEILKEAAQAMTEMENIQKDTELRYNEMIEDLQQRIQHLEMERDVDNPLNPIKLNSAVMSDIMGHSDIGGNGVSINAVQKIRELEGLLKQSEVKLVELQSENLKLEGALSKRNETISEYEGKVQELTFKNSELLETIQNKEKEIVAAEHLIHSIRLTNDNLKMDNENLITALRETQEKFQNEVTNSKTYENQVREQQHTLNRMQSTISIKTANAARLLERIQEYEKMVTRINIERNIFKRENRFFRTIINKLEIASSPTSALTATTASALTTTTATSALTTTAVSALTTTTVSTTLSSLIPTPIFASTSKQKTKNLGDGTSFVKEGICQQYKQQLPSNIDNYSYNNINDNSNNNINRSCPSNRHHRHYNNDRCDHFYYKLFNEFVEHGRFSRRCKCCRSGCKKTLTAVKSVTSPSSTTTSETVVETAAADMGPGAIITPAPTNHIQGEYQCKQKLSVNIATISTAAAASASASASASTSGAVAAAAVTTGTTIGSFHCLTASASTVNDHHNIDNEYHLSTHTNQLLKDYLQNSPSHITKHNQSCSDLSMYTNTCTRKIIMTDDSDDDFNVSVRASTASSPITTKGISRRYSIKKRRLLRSVHKTSSSLSCLRQSKSMSATSLLSSNSSDATTSCSVCDVSETHEIDI